VLPASQWEWWNWNSEKTALEGPLQKGSGKAAGLWMGVRRIARGNRHIQC